MSDLLIKGMDLPTDDIVSLIAVFSCGDVKFIDRTTFSTFYIPQKAIEVPSHGRLIDADKLLEELSDCEMKSYGYNGSCDECEDRNICRVRVLLKDIEDTPTVLEANNGE